MPDNYDDDDYDLPDAPLANLRLPGYKDISAEFTKEELRCGYCDEGGELDLNDMFGAFDVDNFGLVGGANTVNDYTPEGVEDRIGGREIGGASGGEGRGRSNSRRYP